MGMFRTIQLQMRDDMHGTVRYVGIGAGQARAGSVILGYRVLRVQSYSIRSCAILQKDHLCAESFLTVIKMRNNRCHAQAGGRDITNPNHR